MYSKKTCLLLGFHGCDKKVRDAVINGDNLKPSLNSYDWLGNGIYFWESDPQRALEWAQQLAKRHGSSVKEPAVIGAVIDLGNCLDLTNRQSIPLLELGYAWLKTTRARAGQKMPQNLNVGSNTDLLKRELDCSVIEAIHEIISEDKSLKILPFDSVRGLFFEGPAVYEGSGFREKTHTQLCIKNPNCIKGYFLPRQLDKGYPIP